MKVLPQHEILSVIGSEYSIGRIFKIGGVGALVCASLGGAWSYLQHEKPYKVFQDEVPVLFAAFLGGGLGGITILSGVFMFYELRERFRGTGEV